MSHLNTYLQDKLEKYHKYNTRANELYSLLSSVSQELLSGNSNKLDGVIEVLGGAPPSKRLTSSTISSANKQMPPSGNKRPVSPSGNRRPTSPSGNKRPVSPSGNKRPVSPSGNKRPVSNSDGSPIQEDLDAIVDIISEIQSISFQEIEDGIRDLIARLDKTTETGSMEVEKLQQQLADVKSQIAKIRTQASSARSQVSDKVKNTLGLLK